MACLAKTFLAGLMLAAAMPVAAKAGDITNSNDRTCNHTKAAQVASNAGVLIRNNRVEGTTTLYRFLGTMRWQGKRMWVGAEVHLFTCELTNIVAPVQIDTPLWGKYRRAYERRHGGHI